MAPRRGARVVKVQNVVNYENLTVKEVLCPICRSILIEPVTLPCNHGFCSSCFQGTMENANLVCPLCRIRIASWLRSSRKENKLINVDYWKAIQKNFPVQIKNKLEGIEENLDYETPFICLAKPGELKQEYEKQFKEEADSIKKEREAEVRASEELINKIKQEEENQRKLEEEKLKLDEEIARKIAAELNSPQTSKVKKNGKHKTIDKYFKNNNIKDVQKKEFTCKILYQETKSSETLSTYENVSKKKIDEVQKRITEAGSTSDSSDSIDQECRFFKPIDNRCNIPCFKSSPLKIPVIRPKKTPFKLKPPNGKHTLRTSETNDVISAFTKFIPFAIQNSDVELKTKKEKKISSLEKKASSPEKKVSSPEKKMSSPEKKSSSPEKKASSPEKKTSSPEKKTSSPEKKQHNGQMKSPKKNISSPSKRKCDNEDYCVKKKIKAECNGDRLLDTPTSPFRGFPPVIVTDNKLVDEKKLKEQEKMDYELAKKLQDQFNRNSYPTRSATVPRKKCTKTSKQTTLDKLIVKKTYKV